VQISSDYVFDGKQEIHFEDEQFSPLNVYGQSKAAGDLAVSANPYHYIIRTSWVTGSGKNFIRTMSDLARRGVKPKVVSDQVGRLTDTDDLASCIYYLLTESAEYGTYNFSCSGYSMSWADIASEIFVRSGRSAEDIQRVTSAQYSQTHPRTAVRPKHSTLSLDKVINAGISPMSMEDLFLKVLGNR
jgi:dTDP-4-dehydrorhamnose 3,5-epimerase